jgi:gamma-glutamylputrescine oxidase
MLSYWEKSYLLPKADVFILGEGIVGFSAAISLKQMDPSLSVCLLDGFPIGQGASTKNAGFACYGSMTEILDDLRHMDESSVWNLVKMRWDGLQLLRNRLGDAAIQYEDLGGYELFNENDKGAFEQCCDFLNVFNSKIKDITGISDNYQIKTSLLSKFELGSFKKLIYNKGEGQLNTGLMYKAFLNKLKELDITSFRGFRTESIQILEDSITLTNDLGWQLPVSKLIVATNGFARKLLPKMDVVGSRNQVLVTKPINNLKIKGAFHFDRGYYYFRDVDNRILLGGGRQNDLSGETTMEFGNTNQIMEPLYELLFNKLFPKKMIEIETIWSGILGIGKSKAPIIQKVGNNAVAAVRMGGMGVAIGSLVGHEAAKMIFDNND